MLLCERELASLAPRSSVQSAYGGRNPSGTTPIQEDVGSILLDGGGEVRSWWRVEAGRRWRCRSRGPMERAGQRVDVGSAAVGRWASRHGGRDLLRVRRRPPARAFAIAARSGSRATPIAVRLRRRAAISVPPSLTQGSRTTWPGRVSRWMQWVAGISRSCQPGALLRPLNRSSSTKSGRRVPSVG